MSWDVILLKLLNDVQAPEQIPEDFVRATIGTRSTVQFPFVVSLHSQASERFDAHPRTHSLRGRNRTW